MKFEELYKTEKEESRIIELLQLQSEKARELSAGGDRDQILKELHKVGEEISEIVEAYTQRYIDSFEGSVEAILQEANERIIAIPKSEFELYEQSKVKQLEDLNNFSKEDQRLLELIEQLKTPYDHCFDFLLYEMNVYIKALYQIDKEEFVEEIEKLIKNKAKSWGYKEESNRKFNFITKGQEVPKIYYNNMSRGVALLSDKSFSKDIIADTSMQNVEEIEYVIENYSQLVGKIGVNTDKLLDAGIMELGNINSPEDVKKGKIKCEVTFSLEDYALLLGKDIEKKDTLKVLRRSIKPDLDILSSLKITAMSQGKKGQDYVRISILTKDSIKGNVVTMKFSEEFALALLSSGQMYRYPKSLYAISAREPNVRRLGKKISMHESNYNNIYSNTNRILSVDTLLKNTDLPTIEEVRSTRTSWEQRIKEPFEKALDGVVNYGIIKDWEYCWPKSVPLTEQEAYSIDNYEAFSKLYIKYEPVQQTEKEEGYLNYKEERKDREKKKKTNRKNSK